MRTPRPTVPSLLAAAALTLVACTSGDADPAPSPDEDAQTRSADDGLEGEAGNQGWMCQYVSPPAVESAAGGQAQTPREVVTQDDEEGWVCDVLVGGPGAQEPVITLGIHLGEEARDEARGRAEGAEGVRPGPEHLGLSFVSPGLVTGLTLCTDPDATDADQRIPYSLVAESHGEADEKTTALLQRTLTEVAKNLDGQLGCSPSQARSDGAEQTEAP